MTLKAKGVVLATLVAFLLLTWMRWDVIAASLVSLFATIAISLRDFDFSRWQFDVVEYWIAVLVWICVGAWLARRAFSPQQHRKRISEIVILTFAIVAATSPILVPVPPNMQGNLVNAQMLPPLSSGFRFEDSSQHDGHAHTIDDVRIEANTFLLRPAISFASDTSEKKDTAKRGQMFFLLGTDAQARDVFSRVLVGTRVSLVIGCAAAIGALLIGTLVGFLAGYSNRVVDVMLMRTTDIVLAVPSLFLVIGIMALFDQSVFTLILVLATTGWMGIARTVRTEVQKLKQQEFILVARMLNQSAAKILLRHFLPNLKPLLVTAAVLQFGNAVLAEAALSFLGLGIQPPTASWGNMLAESFRLQTGWWLTVFPGIMLSMVLLSVQNIADRRTSLQ